MKLRKILFIIPASISIATLVGCKSKEITDEEKISGYYKDFDFDLPGSYLIDALQTHTWEKHVNYIPYSAFTSYCQQTNDHNSIENVPGTANNQWFYTGREAKGVGTREHVWPCANSSGLWNHSQDKSAHDVDATGYAGGGSDLYHVRSCYTTINTARGNGKYVDFDDEEMLSLKDGVVSVTESKGKYPLKIQGFEEVTKNGKTSYQYADKVEVDDKMKGDIARIVLYVWMHYTDRGNYPDGYAEVKYSAKKAPREIYFSEMVGSLDFMSVLGYTSLTRCAEKLIEWNELDPPSEVEKQRNNTVQKIQGNRNPFVDYPDIVPTVLEDYLFEVE